MRGDELFAQIALRPPFTKLHPRVAAFFKDYLSREKAVRFGERFVINTNFPPYPSRAFESLTEGFRQLGDTEDRRLFSVTVAVTNRCSFRCWHCYNAGRSQTDVPLDVLARTAAELQGLGAVMVTITGGEPLLRDDLEQIAASFDERSCLIVGTTGWGLTAERARRLRDNGVFAVGISLDSADEAEHDRLRGKPGAFRAALDAVRIARAGGLYPYVVSVATREFLQPDRFFPFLAFAASAGALEMHLLEPSATGRLAGRSDVVLSEAERQRIFDYQERVAADDRLPILSSFAYIEGPDAFGCGAGLTHLYIDGSGEVCPCNLVPLSFGNIASEPLADILARMGCFFCKPRTACVGRTLAKHIPEGALPTAPEVSGGLCREYLPPRHAEPRFFRIRAEAGDEVGRGELQAAYDRVHGDYDAFWLVEAARPIHEVVGKLPWRGDERVFEAGCGTGYATVLLAERAGSVLAVDLSEGMLAEARKRLAGKGCRNVELVAGDALESLGKSGPFGLVFSSWVLGYIPLKPFFAAAAGALVGGGRLAFVVHKENSPRELLEIFAELAARDPSVLGKRVAFDFPRGVEHVRDEMAAARLDVEDLWDGVITFRYNSPQAVLDHLLKSGAGTAFYDAIDPHRRDALTDEFLGLLAQGKRGSGPFEVVHDYVACMARKP
jgi:MoaA/NifB/PqqE/SkfB family radical SAM enzyme/protein-L-isoaspartate O-methyltransferase